MGEYSREQRNQLSRVIANNENKSRQPKGIMDPRYSSLPFQFSKTIIKNKPNNIIQMLYHEA